MKCQQRYYYIYNKIWKLRHLNAILYNGLFKTFFDSYINIKVNINWEV